MSTVDNSNIKVGNTLNLEQLITNLNKLGAQTQSAYSGGGGSSASTTWVVANTKTFTVEADDLIIMHGNLNYSISDGSATTGRVGLFANAAQVGTDFIIGSDDSSSGGIKESAGLTINVGDLSGSITFDLKFSRSTGGGTVYAGPSYLWFEVIKRRA